MKIRIILYSLFFISCAKNNICIVGKYTSYKHSYISNCFDFLQDKNHTTNDNIEINNDSTFVYKNCSMIMSGNWKVKNDSLLLYINKKTFVIDSLNYSEKYKYATKTNSIPMIFKIKNNHLIFKFKDFKNNKVYTDMKKN